MVGKATIIVHKLTDILCMKGVSIDRGDIYVGGEYIGNITAERFCGKKVTDVIVHPEDSSNYRYEIRVDDEVHWIPACCATLVEYVVDWPNEAAGAAVTYHGERFVLLGTNPAGHPIIAPIGTRMTVGTKNLTKGWK